MVAGRFTLSYLFMSGAIGQGYATVSTDAGVSTDPSGYAEWVYLSPGNMNVYAMQNFGSVAINDQAIIAKSVIESFYGRPPKYSYWSGCSEGGRQALMLAQRYPTACEINAITEAVIASCDEEDGIADGLIVDPDACEFDPFSMVGKTFNCSDTGVEIQISHPAAMVANVTWSGPISANGKQIWYGMEKGTLLAGSDGYAAGIASIECSSNGNCTGQTGNSGAGWLQSTVLKDPSFNLTDLTLEGYSWLMHLSEVE
ncbi:alpha/beta-Hydrolase [Botryosphaeria dothidea]|uniref:Carboxylic ester hydrolase n=1 Tax=Botryosphaeria dothidea TaxID=55169 RepID=A0A8H4IYB6_9PEZI|nr:alpha/beta-Hydrolase [Botryosphaeria dothidea]